MTIRVASRALAVFAATLAPAIGCGIFDHAGKPASPPPAMRGVDEPPPLHTGGLDVMTVNGSAQQGPVGSPASHGDPVFEALATGIGVGVVGVTGARTAAACAQPDASPTCLRGPGPADNERDAGP